MLGKKKASKKLDAAVLAINSMLAQIYKNKSTDEYKMKGDITKSPSYKQIEEMISDLKTLKGYSPNDARDMTSLFNTLHRPVFRTMVKEYIVDPNDKNTVFTSMYTVGYRLLVGELARIFAATEATPKGIVYKPNKMSRKDDASKLIKIFNDDLENKLNKLVQDMKKHPEESPVSESYLMLLLEPMIQETVEPEEKVSADNGAPAPVNEEAADVGATNGSPKTIEESDKPDTDVLKNLLGEFIKNKANDPNKKTYKLDELVPPSMKEKIERKIEPAAVKEANEAGAGPGENDPGASEDADMHSTDDTSSVTESATFTQEASNPNGSALHRAAERLENTAKSAENYSKLLGVIVGSVALLGGLFADVFGLLKGLNPISDINYMFMNSYDKKVAKLGNVASMYEATKKAYDEYMKIPESQRKKKVESKYLKDLEKYNITMNNLSAQIEHFNSRAKKESQEVVDSIEKKMPNDKVPQGGDPGNTVKNDDDDFQF